MAFSFTGEYEEQQKMGKKQKLSYFRIRKPQMLNGSRMVHCRANGRRRENIKPLLKET